MAIAHDNSYHDGLTTGTTATFNYTTTGSNLLLTMGVGTTANVEITGVTYDGVAMTRLVDRQASFGSTWKISIFYLAGNSVATGTNEVVVTAASSVNKYPAAASYTGVDQDNPINAFTAQFQALPPVDISTTPTVDDCWGIIYGQQADAAFDATGTNTTVRLTESTAGQGDSNGTVTKDVSLQQTMPYTGGTRENGGVQMMIAPAVAVTFVPKVMMF